MTIPSHYFGIVMWITFNCKQKKESKLINNFDSFIEILIIKLLLDGWKQ